MLRFCYFLSLITLFFVAQAAGQQPVLRSDYIAYYEEPETGTPSQTNDIISKFGHLSPRQLADTASYYEKRNIIDTALLCYSLIINAPVKEDDVELQMLKIRVLNEAAVLYFWMCDYITSYDLLLKAVDLCEKHRDDSTEYKIQANIGNIYYRFNEYGLAKRYYLRALKLCRDSTSMMLLYDNIGEAEIGNGELDSAYHYLNKSLQISNRIGNPNLYALLSTTISIYHKKELYDSAFHSLRTALDYSREIGREEYEAENLADMGKLFFETHRPDSAIYYIDISNRVARENSFYNILLENYLTLSQIEESRGRHAGALEELKKYSNLKDSIFSANRLMDINNLQRLYEVSITNRQIEELAVEQTIKERIIDYQKVVLIIAFAVLLLVVAILLFVFLQKRRLNKAYKALVDKNIEIISLQKHSSGKQAKSTPRNDKDDELLDKILAVMEESAIICDPKFSMNMLSSLVEANHIYVSQVINNMLSKNFRSLLNGYRIREAQRLFSEPDAAKYTIESVSLMVGYKSSSTFRAAFAEITGVSPSFYLKSIHKNAKR